MECDYLLPWSKAFFRSQIRETWYQLAICEKVLGKEHPNTVLVRDNMKKTYDSAGFAEAFEDWLRKGWRANGVLFTRETSSNDAPFFFAQKKYYYKEHRKMLIEMLGFKSATGGWKIWHCLVQLTAICNRWLTFALFSVYDKSYWQNVCSVCSAHFIKAPATPKSGFLFIRWYALWHFGENLLTVRRYR